MNRTKKQKMRILSGVVATAMVLTMTPQMSQEVQAATAKTVTKTVKTQKQLDAALKNKMTGTIIIKNGKSNTYTVKKGTYNVKLTVDASKANVVNNATFKKGVTIEDGKSFKEKADGNAIQIKDSKLSLNIAASANGSKIYVEKKDSTITLKVDGTPKAVNINKKAEVSISGNTKTAVPVTSNANGASISTKTKTDLVLNKQATVTAQKGASIGTVTAKAGADISVQTGAKVSSVAVQGKNSDVKLTVNGTVGKVKVDAKADVAIAGTSTKAVKVEANTKGATVQSSVKTAITVNAEVKVTLTEGAEGSKVTAGKKDVEPAVVNNTKEEVTVTDKEGNKETVNAGESVGKVETPAPAKTAEPSVAPQETVAPSAVPSESPVPSASESPVPSASASPSPSASASASPSPSSDTSSGSGYDWTPSTGGVTTPSTGGGIIPSTGGGIIPPSGGDSSKEPSESDDEKVTNPVNPEVDQKGPDANGNYIVNGDFANGFKGWTSFVDESLKDKVSYTVDNQNENPAAVFTITDTSETEEKIQLCQDGINLEKDKWYELTFDAKTDINNGRDITCGIQHNGSSDNNWETYSGSQTASLTKEYQSFSRKFQMQYSTDENSRLSISMGAVNGKQITETHNVCIDNVTLKEIEPEVIVPEEKGNMLMNADFTQGDDGLEGWIPGVEEPGAAEFKASDNGVNINIENVGDTDFSVQLKQSIGELCEGHKYRFRMKVTSDVARTIKVYLMTSDYVNYGETDCSLIQGKTDIDEMMNIMKTTSNDIWLLISMGKIKDVETNTGKIRIEHISLEEVTN